MEFGREGKGHIGYGNMWEMKKRKGRQVRQEEEEEIDGETDTDRHGEKGSGIDIVTVSHFKVMVCTQGYNAD